MNRTQVSLRGETYDRLKAHCERTGGKIADLVTRLCAEYFEKAEIKTEPEPVKSEIEPEPAPAPAKVNGGHKTNGVSDDDPRKITF